MGTNYASVRPLKLPWPRKHLSRTALCLPYVKKSFKDFEHGLGIISQRTGKRSFVIEKKVIDDPDKELSRWVVESFGQSEAKDS